MTLAELQPVVDAAWDDRDTISTTTTGEVRDAVEATLNALDSGELRVAEKGSDGWVVNQWAKKAVLLSFRLNDMEMISGGPGSNSHWWDKVPSKFEGWECLYRSRSCADAKLCQSRRICGQRYNG